MRNVNSIWIYPLQGSYEWSCIPLLNSIMLFFVKVFSENWVVYHYFNLRAHRYEMSVVEIYDQSRAVYHMNLTDAFLESYYV